MVDSQDSMIILNKAMLQWKPLITITLGQTENSIFNVNDEKV